MTAFDALRLEETAEELLERAPAGYLSTLADGTVVRVNDTFCRWTGLRRHDVLGRPFPNLLTAAGRVYHDTHVLPLMFLRGEVRDVSVDIVCAGNRRLPVLINANVKRGEDGEPVLVRMAVFDATDRLGFQRELVRARRTAEASGRRLRILQQASSAFAEAGTTAEVLDALGHVLADGFTCTGADAWLLEPDAQLLRRAGGPAVDEHGDERLGTTVLDLGVPTPLTDAFRLRDVIAVRPATASAQDYPDSAAALIAARIGLLVAAPLVAEGQATGVYHVAFRRPPDRWADDLDLFRTIGVAAGTALERARLHEQLQFRATHDPLTTAANRPLFIERLDRALLDGADRGRPTTVMFMDLDGFKDVNDRFGHRVGDELLVEMVRRLRAALRPRDTVARLGGDEFAVLCADTGAQGADAVARRLEQAVSVPYRSEGGVLSVTASVGITVHDPAAQGAGTPTSAQLLKDADAAMYLAKATGKNRHVVYDEELESRLSRRAEVEQLLREALDGDGVVLHFQPVFDLARHVATGVEALCRLRDRDGTLVPPDEFIGIAEERGLIARLGRRILERACAQVAAWDADGARPVTLAVNIAADQAARPDFADEVLAVLEGTGFPADRLLLELTESALLEATDATIDGLRQLRDRGIGIALDDFGTRYASLHYVQQLPLTTLKIDRSFVAPLPGGPAERAIVRSVAALAHELGLRCTAEGIETDEQRQFLADLGVQGQGYLLAVPMDAAGCRAVLDAGD